MCTCALILFFCVCAVTVLVVQAAWPVHSLQIKVGAEFCDSFLVERCEIQTDGDTVVQGPAFGDDERMIMIALPMACHQPTVCVACVAEACMRMSA